MYIYIYTHTPHPFYGYALPHQGEASAPAAAPRPPGAKGCRVEAPEPRAADAAAANGGRRG